MALVGTGYYPTDAQGAKSFIEITQRNVSDTLVVQNLRKATPFLKFILDEATDERAGGFSPITQPVLTETYGQVPEYTDFSGNFSSPVTKNPIISAMWNQSLVATAVGYTQPELSLTQGSGAEKTIIDNISARLNDAYKSNIEFLSSALLGSAGTNTLAMNGIQDMVDDGTVSPNYGNISRSLEPKWNAAVYTNTQTGAAWAQVQYYIQSYLNSHAGGLPNLGLCSYAVFQALATSFTNNERMVVSDIKGMVKDRTWEVQSVGIGGVPIVVDPNITGDTMYFLNSDHLKFSVNPDFHFKMTEPESLTPTGVLGFVQVLTMSGQLWSDLPSSHFKLNSAPSIALA